MEGKDFPVDMQESIKNFLPLYFATKKPIHPSDSIYPTEEINRFHIVLDKYMDFLKSTNRHDEFYMILEKRLIYSHIIINNARDMIELWNALIYYRHLMYIDKCDNGKNKSQMKQCESKQMKELFIKYKLPDKKYFFTILERDYKYRSNDFVEGSTNLPAYKIQLKEEMDKLNKKYLKKLKKVSMNTSEQSLNEYQQYLDSELKPYEKPLEIIKFSVGIFYVQIQKLLSLKNVNYKYLVQRDAKIFLEFFFMDRVSDYKRYETFIHRYNDFIKSCPK